jgi:N-acetyl-gamma-glutamyl-phosphate reductase
MIDARLKGSAGTAIHAMNLLFGLHERVGLALKASVY